MAKTSFTKENDKEEFTEYLCEKTNPEIIVNVAKMHTDLAYDILRLVRTRGIANLETQKELAKTSFQASEYFLEILKNQAFYEDLDNNTLAKWFYEIGSAQPSLLYDI